MLALNRINSMLLLRLSKNLLEPVKNIQNAKYLSNKSAVITKIHRKLYLKPYQTLMVQPDGSTFMFRHYEPRRIIKLPLDMSLLSEEEKAEVLERRKPKKKVVIEEEIQDDFNSKQYLQYIKKG